MPLATWIHYRDEYLDANIALKGRGRRANQCAGCEMESPSYRCRDCHGLRMYCRGCILQKHVSEPLHVLEVCTVLLSPYVSQTNSV